jgi:hypothetical protein
MTPQIQPVRIYLIDGASLSRCSTLLGAFAEHDSFRIGYASLPTH